MRKRHSTDSLPSANGISVYTYPKHKTIKLPMSIRINLLESIGDYW